MPVIIVLLLGAAYFAVMETAFASASRIRLKAAADHGNRRAGQALYVLDHFDQAITTLLIGTNILHLTIATLVTVAVQRQWGMWAVTAGTLVTTVVVFFAGEMLPKSIAKKYAERLAMRTAGSLRFFMVLFKPLSAQNKHDFVLMFRNRNGFYKHVLSLLAGISSRRKNNYFILILVGFFDKPFFYVRVYAVRDNETRRFMFYRRFENVAYKLSRIMNRVGILINVFVNKAVYSLIC